MKLSGPTLLGTYAHFNHQICIKITGSSATLRGLSKATAFFLDILSSKHPSPHLQRLSKSLAPLLTGHPRLQQFSAERDFAVASRRWKDKIKTLRIELDRIPEEARDDGFENWWDRLSDIVGVLEGRVDVIKRICEEVGADWKEVTAVWGVYIDGRLRRAGLPYVSSFHRAAGRTKSGF